MQKGLQFSINTKLQHHSNVKDVSQCTQNLQCEGVVGCCHAVAAHFMSANDTVYMLGGKHQHPAQGRHTERTHKREAGVCQQHILSKQAT